MKRFIIAIAALGMFSPLAAQAAPAVTTAPVAQTAAAASAHQPTVKKGVSHLSSKDKSKTVHKTSKHQLKKTPAKTSAKNSAKHMKKATH